MQKGLFKNISWVSLMTLLSRGLGFARDTLMAIIFGTTAGFDAFLVAFKIPNFARALFAEGAISHAFVPVLTQYQEQYSEAEVREFIAKILGLLIVVCLLLTMVLEILTPLLVIVFAPGFKDDPARYVYTCQMLRITFPYVSLILLTAFLGSLLNSRGHFIAPSLTPIFLNLVLIAAALFLPSFFQPKELALAFGVFIAGWAQLLFQIPFLIKYRKLHRPRWGLNDKKIFNVFRGLIPALFGVSVMQIGLLITTFFASFLASGSISWLYYADRITFLPLGIFAVALATVILPHLSKLSIHQQAHEFSSILDWSLRLLLIISLPAMVGFLFFSGPLIITLFYHGHFNLLDVKMTEQSLLAFSIGLPALMCVKVLTIAFYSRQNIHLPVRIALYTTLLNIILNCILIGPLAHRGLALSVSLSAIINAIFLLFPLIKQEIYRPMPGWKKFWLQLLFSNSMLTLLLLMLVPAKASWLTWQWQARLSHLIFWLCLAIVFYFFCLVSSGFSIKKFFYGKSNVVPIAT
jgi:putative peptidoglycan lipid II flippase